MLRRVLNKVHPLEALQLLIDRVSKTDNNGDFLRSINKATRDDD